MDKNQVSNHIQANKPCVKNSAPLRLDYDHDSLIESKKVKLKWDLLVSCFSLCLNLYLNKPDQLTQMISHRHSETTWACLLLVILVICQT